MMHKKFTPHSPEVIDQILNMSDNKMRVKDISNYSKEIFGYKIKQSTISEILKRYKRNAKANTYFGKIKEDVKIQNGL